MKQTFVKKIVTITITQFWLYTFCYSQQNGENNKLVGHYHFFDSTSNKIHYLTLQSNNSTFTGNYFGITIEKKDTLYYMANISDVEFSNSEIEFQLSDISLSLTSFYDTKNYSTIDNTEQLQLISKYFIDEKVLELFLGFRFTGQFKSNGLELKRFLNMIDSSGDKMFFLKL